MEETQLALTNHMMHLCKRNGMADLTTRPSLYMLPCRIWSYSFCIKRCRHKYRRTPTLGALGLRTLGVGCGWPSKNNPPLHIYYYVKFGSHS